MAKNRALAAKFQKHKQQVVRHIADTYIPSMAAKPSHAELDTLVAEWRASADQREEALRLSNYLRAQRRIRRNDRTARRLSVA